MDQIKKKKINTNLLKYVFSFFLLIIGSNIALIITFFFYKANMTEIIIYTIPIELLCFLILFVAFGYMYFSPLFIIINDNHISLKYFLFTSNNKTIHYKKIKNVQIRPWRQGFDLILVIYDNNIEIDYNIKIKCMRKDILEMLEKIAIENNIEYDVHMRNMFDYK